MKIYFKIICLILLVSKSFSQSMDVKWSAQFDCDNKLDGFFDSYLGTNGDYVYCKFSNLALVPKKFNRKVKILAFDKNTLKKVGDAELKGYDKTKNAAELDYFKTIVLKETIYILWTKKVKGIVELYAQSFDEKLKRKNKLKKVYEVSTAKGASEKLVVISNKDYNNSILIIKEMAVANDGDNLRIEYKLLDEEFNFVSAKQLNLPIKIYKKRSRLAAKLDNFSNHFCSYEFGDDGNLYIHQLVSMTDEEKENLRKGEASSYTEMMQVKLESGELSEFAVKFNNKNTFKFSSRITKNGIKLYGFFSDLDIDKKGKDSHGIFYVLLDKKNFRIVETKFSYFDKAFLDVLYAADKENQKKGRGLFKSKEAKNSDDQSLDDQYVIEKVIDDNGDIVLFCSIMNNWSQTNCTTNSNGGQSCTTRYYCTKSNVTVFKLNIRGDIIWAKNLDRKITYNGWYVHDVNVVKQDNDYYVVYGSAYQINAEKKNRRSAKSSKQLTDRFEFAVFASNDGSFRKNEYQVNKLGVKKNDKKYVNEADITVYDNKMFTSCSRTKLKPSTYFACLCPPVFYFKFFSGNSRKGTAFLGSIEPLRR